MAKGSKHYLPDGRLYKGATHKMDGELHSGATHTSASKVLTHSPSKKLASAKAKKKVGKIMREYKEGTLHSGKSGPVVKSRKQAIAIALSEAARAGKK